MPRETPIVYVVDDGLSAREALVALMCYAGHRAELYASAGGFLTRRAAVVPSLLVLDVAP